MNTAVVTNLQKPPPFHQIAGRNGSKAHDYESRLTALESSKELYDIYRHPHWVKLMQLISNAKSGHALHRLRIWVASHHQLAPVLAWFNACTRKYGFSFDAFARIPTSLLLLQEHREAEIAYHTRMIAEHQHQLLRLQGEQYYPECSDGSVGKELHGKGDQIAGAPCVRSCWNVLVVYNAQHAHASAAGELRPHRSVPFRAMTASRSSAGDLSSLIDTEPEPLSLPPAVSGDR
jgi:hypothetical protein